MSRWPRHRWVKVRPHVYICRQCGCGKVNALGRDGWRTTFHRPDGTAVVATHVPACATGPRTGAYLTHHASAIACAVPARRRHVTV